MKVAINTIHHQYHIICMQNIYDNQFHCNIIFLIKLFLENFLFYVSTEHQRPILAYHTIIALIFVMVCLRYHTVLWVNKSEYLPYEGIQVLLFFSTVATHETSDFFLENTNTIGADSLSFATSTSQKKLPV